MDLLRDAQSKLVREGSFSNESVLIQMSLCSDEPVIKSAYNLAIAVARHADSYNNREVGATITIIPNVFSYVRLWCGGYDSIDTLKTWCGLVQQLVTAHYPLCKQIIGGRVYSAEARRGVAQHQLIMIWPGLVGPDSWALSELFDYDSVMDMGLFLEQKFNKPMYLESGKAAMLIDAHKLSGAINTKLKGGVIALLVTRWFSMMKQMFELITDLEDKRMTCELISFSSTEAIIIMHTPEHITSRVSANMRMFMGTFRPMLPAIEMDHSIRGIDSCKRAVFEMFIRKKEVKWTQRSIEFCKYLFVEGVCALRKSSSCDVSMDIVTLQDKWQFGFIPDKMHHPHIEGMFVAKTIEHMIELMNNYDNTPGSRRGWIAIDRSDLCCGLYCVVFASLHTISWMSGAVLTEAEIQSLERGTDQAVDAWLACSPLARMMREGRACMDILALDKDHYQLCTSTMENRQSKEHFDHILSSSYGHRYAAAQSIVYERAYNIIAAAGLPVKLIKNQYYDKLLVEGAPERFADCQVEWKR